VHESRDNPWAKGNTLNTDTGLRFLYIYPLPSAPALLRTRGGILLEIHSEINKRRPLVCPTRFFVTVIPHSPCALRNPFTCHGVIALQCNSFEIRIRAVAGFSYRTGWEGRRERETALHAGSSRLQIVMAQMYADMRLQWLGHRPDHKYKPSHSLVRSNHQRQSPPLDTPTVRDVGVVSTPVSYSADTGFKSRPGNRLSWLRCFVVFLKLYRQMSR
jgi:hypothetical protein